MDEASKIELGIFRQQGLIHYPSTLRKLFHLVPHRSTSHLVHLPYAIGRPNLWGFSSIVQLSCTFSFKKQGWFPLDFHSLCNFIGCLLIGKCGKTSQDIFLKKVGVTLHGPSSILQLVPHKALPKEPWALHWILVGLGLGSGFRVICDIHIDLNQCWAVIRGRNRPQQLSRLFLDQ
jgi:hypothetical protein